MYASLQAGQFERAKLPGLQHEWLHDRTQYFICQWDWPSRCCQESADVWLLGHCSNCVLGNELSLCRESRSSGEPDVQWMRHMHKIAFATSEMKLPYHIFEVTSFSSNWLFPNIAFFISKMSHLLGTHRRCYVCMCIIILCTTLCRRQSALCASYA